MVFCLSTCVLEYLGRIDTRRNVLFWLWFRDVIGAYFDVIDQDICEVYGCGQIPRKLHLPIDDELDMMSPRRKLDDCRKNAVGTAKDARLAFFQAVSALR